MADDENVEETVNEQAEYIEGGQAEGEQAEGENVEDEQTEGEQPETVPDENEGEDEEVDDELKDVEEMIQQASEELEKVAEGSQQMMDALQESKEAEGDLKEPKEKDESSERKGEKNESVFKFDPTIDAAVLKELEEAEKQAKITAGVIADLKSRVAELLKKEEMTESEAKELEKKNKDLKVQMKVFEEKTKRIQFLLGQANLFDRMTKPQPPLQTKHAEDALPKMLVCGFGGDDLIPKIVLMNDRCKQRLKKCEPRCEPPKMGPMVQKLNQSYTIQEKLVSENANLEDTRYKLQSDLLNKDKKVETLQRQLCTLQNEMRMMYQQNTMTSEKNRGCNNPSCPKNSRSPSPSRKMPCGPTKGICPAEVENRLQQYSNTTHLLEKQLGDMEADVRNIQQEILEVQKEREHLEYHRKLLCGMPPPCYSPSPCYPPPGGPMPPCRPPIPCGAPDASGDDVKYKELREQYNRLQDDFKAKLTEVAGLRADNEKLKDMTKTAEETKRKLEEKVKELDRRIKELRGEAGTKSSGTREQLVELEQQLRVHKEMFRQAQDELEELRALVEDIQFQLNDYRNKYLEAIQTVEEQRRQMDIMKMENNRISEEVNLEILRVKNQFQEKLQELAPLPDILKATQVFWNRLKYINSEVELGF